MEKEIKVLMICFPAVGHLTPLVCYGAELAKNKNVKVIMHNSKLHKKLIESANIEFREVDIYDAINDFTIHELRVEMPIYKILGFYMEACEKIMPELIRCVQEEDIDLIVYDFMTVYAKWFMKRLRAMHQKGELKKPVPKALTFMPSLVHEKGIYPNSFEEKFMIKPQVTLKFAFNMFIFFFKYMWFCRRNQLPVENILDLIFNQKEPLTICCVVPEFQPRSHMFSSGIKFVGNCAGKISVCCS